MKPKSSEFGRAGIRVRYQVEVERLDGIPWNRHRLFQHDRLVPVDDVVEGMGIDPGGQFAGLRVRPGNPHRRAGGYRQDHMGLAGGVDKEGVSTGNVGRDMGGGQGREQEGYTEYLGVERKHARGPFRLERLQDGQRFRTVDQKLLQVVCSFAPGYKWFKLIIGSHRTAQL